MPPIALTSATIYAGDQVLTDRAVVVEDGMVTSMPGELRERAFPGDVIDLSGLLLAPGLIDLQVNGGGDRLFSDTPTVECLEAITAAHTRCGTTDLLATCISGSDEGRRHALGAVDDAARMGLEGLLGVHLEGPLINEAWRGVHRLESVRAAEPERLIADLEAFGRPVPTVVTLAPEVVAPGFIGRLDALGTVVFAGHTEASPDRLEAAIDEGLRGGTHLWNAMPPIRSRLPGPVGVLLRAPQVWCSFIADGQHLHPETLALSLAASPTGTCMLVSDALPPVGGVHPTFEMQGSRITVRSGRCEDAEGRLAGGAVPLIDGVRHCVRRVGVALDEALRMASLYPARCLGLADRRGRIAVGYEARFVVLDAALSVVAVMVGDEFRAVGSTPESP